MNSKEQKISKQIKRVTKPWGNYKRYAHNEKCSVKIITVNLNQKLSEQIHKKRDELWIILDEGLSVQVDTKILKPKPGDEITIPRNTIHRLSSLGRKGRVLEVAFGHYDEDDIKRISDIYERK